MSIGFKRLKKNHFPLLLKWLNAPHVNKWWDSEVEWTEHLINEKYSSYIKGYKLTHLGRKPIHPYIIFLDGKEIGYIQFYNAYDFSREGYKISGLSENLAAIDIFIGEEEYMGKGLGKEIINQFLGSFVFQKFVAVFVDPKLDNKAAVRAYQKAGFNIIKLDKKLNLVWMVRERIKL